MSALACAATHFMGGNGHFISGRRKSSGRKLLAGREEVVCNNTNMLLLVDDRSSGKAPVDADGFARRSAYGEVVNR